MTPSQADAEALAAIVAEVDARRNGLAAGTTSKVDQIRAGLLDTVGLRALPRPEFLIDGLLVVNSLAELYSRPGGWKSFLALDWACRIATGTAWAEASVRAGSVLYVLAEGVVGMADRVTAWEEHNGLSLPADRLTWYPQPILLADEGWADALGVVAAELAADLVVLDARARVTVGVEENGAKEMGLVVDNLDRIRTTSGATVLTLHHSDAAGVKSRGSTSVLGAVDTELKIVREVGAGTLRLEKQKNAPDGLTWSLRPRSVAESIVVEATPSTPAGGASTDNMRRIAEALLDMDNGDPIPSGVLRTGAGFIDAGQRRTAERAMGDLLKQGLVEKPAKGRWTPTERLSHWLTERRLIDGEMPS